MGLIAPFVIIWMTILRTLISIAAIALLITTLHAEEQPQIASPTDAAPQPTPTPAPPAEEKPPAAAQPHPAEPTPAEDSLQTIQERIKKIREAAASGNFDHKYLEDKIQEVIASMSEQQKEAFEAKMSQEARVAYERYKKSREEEVRKQEQEEAQLEAAEQPISHTQHIVNQERGAVHKFIKENPSKITASDNFNFDLPNQGSEDLRFSVPIEQDVVIYVRLFSNTDGVYGEIQDIIIDEEPVWLYVYENSDRLVTQASFYSQNIIVFQGRANSSYLLRFVNHGTSRLVDMRMNRILLHAHIGGKLVAEDVADHGARVVKTREGITVRLQEQREKLVLQGENQRKLMKGLDHYYFYSIGEIVLLGIICVIQVESIRKLLINSSVV